MLIRFFLMLRAAGVPVTRSRNSSRCSRDSRGDCHLCGLPAKGTVPSENLSAIDQFYFVARTILIKDERHFDRYDRVFAAHFRGAEIAFEAILEAGVPADWLEKHLALQLTEEEKARIQSLGGWDALMETLRKRLEEQKARHQGGNKWIGTGGTSPYGTGGYNPEGIRIGSGGGNRRAVKVWDRREYANLDDSVELGTRNVKLALRRLRRFARQGAAETLDLDGTIDATARRAGLLDIRMVPERHNAVKVLLFLDIGGSMDDHVRICEELFSAARGEFKHLEYFYFHNFVYESVWKDNRRRHGERTSLAQVMRTYGHDYRLVIVGDATMSPYEILQPGGSIEHWNEEAGRRLDEAAARLLSAPRLAQSGAEGSLGIHAVDPHHARAVRGPNVSSHARGLGSCDAKPAIGELPWKCCKRDIGPVRLVKGTRSRPRPPARRNRANCRSDASKSARPRFAHQLLEPRIRTRAGVNQQPRRLPGAWTCPASQVRWRAERAQREVPVSHRIRNLGIDIFSGFERPSENRRHCLAVRDRRRRGHATSAATRPGRRDTLKNSRRACGSASWRARARRKARKSGSGMVAIECLAALVFGLGFFKPPGCMEIELLVARDKHHSRFERDHLRLQLDRLIDAPGGEDQVDQ